MPVHLAPISRRRFLAGAVATGAGLLLPRRLVAGAREADPDRWILLSDLHVPGDRQRENRGIKPVVNFEQARGEYLAAAASAAGIIVSGDLAYNEGMPGDYTVLADLVRPVREAGIPLHMALGNHDHRENFFEAFPEAKQAAELATPDKCISIVETPHANWFLLDSLVKTLCTPGQIGEDQLAWLAKALDARPDRPALVVAHHNPAGTGEKNGLEDTKALLDVLVPRKQVKAYLYGHTHRWESSQVDGLHLVNLPTLVWVFDKTSPCGWVDTRLSPDGAAMKFHALDRSHAAHGQVKELAWRG